MATFAKIKEKESLNKVAILILLEPAVFSTDYESKMMPLIRKHIDANRFMVDIVCSSAGSRSLYTNFRNIHEIQHQFTRFNDASFWLEYVLYLSRSFFKVIKTAKQTNSQLIISMGGHAYSGLVVTIVARILSRRSIIRISEPTRYIVKKRYRFSFLLSALISMAESISFQLCDVVISNRDMSWYHSKVLKKQRILSQGVDLTLFDRKVMPALNSKAFPKLITVSRLDKPKNIVSVIRALKLLKDRYPSIAYHIIGYGPNEENLRKEAKALELGDNVIFHGYVKPEYIPPLLKSCDVFVLPSLIEGVPSAVLEAMACGIPVILGSTRYDYVNWFVNEENVLMARGDPESIAQSIIRITSNNELKREIVHNAFEHVKKYHNSSNTRIHLTKIIRELLSNRE
jgi:glycosyltransferase involved in cell wall biosynthesis